MNHKAESKSMLTITKKIYVVIEWVGNYFLFVFSVIFQILFFFLEYMQFRSFKYPLKRKSNNFSERTLIEALPEECY